MKSLWIVLALMLPLAASAGEPTVDEERERLIAELKARIEAEQAALQQARELNSSVREDIGELRGELQETDTRLDEKEAEVERLKRKVESRGD